MESVQIAQEVKSAQFARFLRGTATGRSARAASRRILGHSTDSREILVGFDSRTLSFWLNRAVLRETSCAFFVLLDNIGRDVEPGDARSSLVGHARKAVRAVARPPRPTRGERAARRASKRRRRSWRSRCGTARWRISASSRIASSSAISLRSARKSRRRYLGPPRARSPARTHRVALDPGGRTRAGRATRAGGEPLVGEHVVHTMRSPPDLGSVVATSLSSVVHLS
jgi:hypothetical protein